MQPGPRLYQEDASPQPRTTAPVAHGIPHLCTAAADVALNPFVYQRPPSHRSSGGSWRTQRANSIWTRHALPANGYAPIWQAKHRTVGMELRDYWTPFCLSGTRRALASEWKEARVRYPRTRMVRFTMKAYGQSGLPALVHIPTDPRQTDRGNPALRPTKKRDTSEMT